MSQAALLLRRLAFGNTAPVLLVAAVLLAIRLVLALSVIPPWQQPDEPSHVALAELQRHRLLHFGDAEDPAREGEILQSMASHDWWEHRGIGWPVPVPTPERFGQVGAANRVAVQVTGITDPPAYFRVAGHLLNWLPRRSIVEDLYLLRALSAVLGVLTLLVVWLAARDFAGTTAAGAVTLLLAVHPQFALVSTGATPDAMTNLLGASLWWQTAALVRTPSVGRLLLVWALGIAAAAADRMGIPLLAVAVAISLVMLTGRFPRTRDKAAVALVSTLVLAIVALAAIIGVLEVFGATYGWKRAFSSLVPVQGAMTMDRFIEFSWQLFRGWWYSVGWGRYTMPAWWMAVAAAVTLAAVAGLSRQLFIRRDAVAPSPAMVTLALAGIALQLLAVYWAYFRMGNGAQGRYLFPMLVPSLVLLWTGIEAWAPRQHRGHVAAALVLTVALLDAAAWVFVAIPAYYASF